MAETTKLETKSLATDEQPDAPAELTQTEDRLSTWQKVGVGAGVIVGAGVAGWALFRVAEHFGWFDGRPSIVIDDDDMPTNDSKDGGGGSKDGGGRSGGSTTTRDRAIGNPPNFSGDPAGYNTELFPGPTPIRVALNTLGYNIAYTGGELAPNGTPNSEVQRFQSDYNKVVRGIDVGKVKLPTSVPQPKRLKVLRGLLVVDGIPGKNSLKALEIALGNQVYNKLTWRTLVKAGRS